MLNVCLAQCRPTRKPPNLKRACCVLNAWSLHYVRFSDASLVTIKIYDFMDRVVVGVWSPVLLEGFLAMLRSMALQLRGSCTAVIPFEFWRDCLQCTHWSYR